MKNKIIPAILVKNFNEIEKLSDEFSLVSDRVQIDICDGKYVSNTTWPFTEMSHENFISLFSKNEDLFLPNWDKINFTADLMCFNVEGYIDTLLLYGFDEIILHFRSLDFETFSIIKQKCHDFEVGIILGVDLKTDVSEFIKFAKENIESISYFQVMGIREIGKQGEKFDDEALEIIKKIKAEFPNKTVMMDGGMNPESIKKCKKVGASVFTIGSYLGDKDLQSTIEFLESL
jgi:pentose-5-phosphate-3-epimerase